MEIGVDSFAAAIGDDGTAGPPAERLRDLLEEIEHADEVGLDVFGIGEHHRREFLDSAPTVILGAAAGRTKRIRLTSAVTVLSAADPVRVFQEFATLDLISRGRAEMVVGRGSFIEAFPLFGLNLDDYDSLFAEKLELLLKIRQNELQYIVWDAFSAARSQFFSNGLMKLVRNYNGRVVYSYSVVIKTDRGDIRKPVEIIYTVRPKTSQGITKTPIVRHGA